jgi:hypothetical protein
MKLTAAKLQTNQVLFPGPGITNKTLPTLSAAANATDLSELKAELDKAHAYSRTLLNVVIVLTCTVGLLIISLVVYFIRGRRLRTSLNVTYVTPATLEKAVKGGGSALSMGVK